MNNIQVLQPAYRVDECMEAIRECLEIGWTGLGFKTVEFEEAWKEYTSLPHAHFLNSATAGLHLALNIFKNEYGWEENKAEVITTPLTFVSTNHAIMYERLVPVFADIHPLTMCLDPESVEACITPNTRAVMYVGVAGRVGHLEEIRRICKKHGLKLILDAAHMAGTKINDIHVGPEADVAVFSFQAVKNLPTADAGMICFQDAEFDARTRKLSWLGIDKDTYTRSAGSGSYKWKYDVPNVGFKYHSNSIMAAIGLVQLKYLDADNNHRRMLADKYNKLLYPDFDGPRDVHNEGRLPSCHLYQIIIEDRDEVLLRMNQQGVCPGVHYIDNTQYGMYSRRYQHNDCAVAKLHAEKLMTLPLHVNMSMDDVERVVQVLRSAVNG